MTAGHGFPEQQPCGPPSADGPADTPPGPERLARLLAPRSLAVVGGEAAAAAIRQCRRLGYTGPIWPVNPSRTELEGLPCHRTVADLPEAPDAALVAVAREKTVDVVADLAAAGAGGAVCYAAGFAEDDDTGRRLQNQLIAQAGKMPVIGPNCIGVVNYGTGAALWPDEQGGSRVERGVGVITQSGNIGQNISMNRRGLPIAQIATLGNGAVTGMSDLITAMANDPAITAIGLHIEGFDDVAALGSAALHALRRGVPVVALKTGTSALGASTNASHTSSMASSDTLVDALFDRVGIGRVRDIEELVETLKFGHTFGLSPSFRLASASCSGGEAALLADRAADQGVVMPPFSADVATNLCEVLGDHVAIGNPLDYHTYIWTDPVAKQRCFEAFLASDHDVHALVVDIPRSDRADPTHWQTTVDAFIAASRTVPGPAAVISLLPDGLPEELAARLMHEGIAALHGVRTALAAIAIAESIGSTAHRMTLPDQNGPVIGVAPEAIAGGDTRPGTRVSASVSAANTATTLSEHAGKQELAQAGVPVPTGRIVQSADDAVAAATAIGFPVVVKAVSAQLTHKSDAGAVRVGLADAGQVRESAEAMAGLSKTLLVEQMIQDALAELVVGVTRDPQFGLALTIGAGGTYVEILQDTATWLLPVTPDDVAEALRSLRIWPVLAGARGSAGADVDAICRVVSAVAAYAIATPSLREVEINPLLIRPESSDGDSAAGEPVAADVVISRTGPIPDHGPAVPDELSRIG